MASLCSQVSFLKNELEGKNLLIRTLIIKVNKEYNDDNIKQSNNTSTNENGINSSHSTSLDDANDTNTITGINTSNTTISANTTINAEDELNDEYMLRELHGQFIEFQNLEYI